MRPDKPRTKDRVDEETLQVEKNLAQKALSSGDRDTAWLHLNSATNRLMNIPSSPGRDALFTSATIELANVSFVLGKGFAELTETLQRALQSAERIGDRRSMAMINLHLGRLFYFAEQRDSAMLVFEKGKYEAESLGDEDILTQAAEFIGLYYFIQGRFQEAIKYFEQASSSFESAKTGRIINPSGPLWLSYSAAFLGQFHRAIGTLDYYRRVATEGGDHGLANLLRSALGIMLVGIKKNKEAHHHLSGAYQEARRTKNSLASYFAKGGIAFHHYLEGRLGETCDWLALTSEEAESGLSRQYASPILLETLFELHKKKIKKDLYLNYADEFKRIMDEPNIHLRGVALRLKAIEQIENNAELNEIESNLKQSEDLLLESGDPVQTGKTRIEMARLELRKEDRHKAILMAEKARKDFAGYMDVFFPDDLRPLLTIERDLNQLADSDDQLLGMFANVIQELTPSTDFDYLLSNTIKSTNRYFGAERGGIFWFRPHNLKKAPILRGPCNLSPSDISSNDFKENLALIFKAFHENRPQVLRRRESGFNPSSIKAMVCVPFEVSGQVRGVLYHDNSYVQDCFDNFSESQLTQMTRWLTSYIDHIFEFSRQMEKKTADQLGALDPKDSLTIITQSPIMRRTLDQTDRIATTDSTVLILGETGVGKELLARRIHQMSRRKNNPMIIVDPTVIPENLVESELFGHEKGAFTGADRQKKGRMELANKGTLFIDEAGEIPLSIQVKLLRAIQEKTMTRIGGTQIIHSDFRLVAATNRDLVAEVAAGRFREDLYYRLNVIPLILPPLRERTDDILLLAKHFLQRFANRYNHTELELSPENEASLNAYQWPGNIRELQNVIERAVLLSTEGRLHLNLPSEIKSSGDNPIGDFPTLDDLQRRYISIVLDKTGGKLSGPGGATEILGLKRSSLYNRMKKLGLR